MKTSAAGIASIALWEGNLLTAYKDSGGVLTIGVGHTSAAGPPLVTSGLQITKQQSADILANDLARFERRVDSALGDVSQNVFDGAVSFDFNTGAIATASWVKAFKAGNMKTAEADLKLWNKVGARIVGGLVTRRAAEADVIFRGLYPKGIGSIPVSTIDQSPAPPDIPVSTTQPAVTGWAAFVAFFRSLFQHLGA